MALHCSTILPNSVSRAGVKGYAHAPTASLHNCIITFLSGRTVFGTLIVSRYANVEMLTLGYCFPTASATLFTRYNNAPIFVPSASSMALHLGQRQVCPPSFLETLMTSVVGLFLRNSRT